MRTSQSLRSAIELHEEIVAKTKHVRTRQQAIEQLAYLRSELKLQVAKEQWEAEQRATPKPQAKVCHSCGQRYYTFGHYPKLEHACAHCGQAPYRKRFMAFD